VRFFVDEGLSPRRDTVGAAEISTQTGGFRPCRAIDAVVPTRMKES